MTTTSM